MSGFNFVTLLQTAISDMAPSGIGRWQFPLEPGASESADLQLYPQWISIGLALPHHLDDCPSPMAALLLQSGWPGNVKRVTDRSRLALRADVPLIVTSVADRNWVVQEVGEAIQGLRAATAHCPPETSPDADSGCDADPELLADRCRITGWHAMVKADGEVHVDIEPRSVRRVVTIVRQKNNLRARVTLGDSDPAQINDERLAAVAHFLLRASTSLRFARAWVSGSAASLSEVGFECTIAASAADSPLVAAIDALATACDLFGCEAETLIESNTVARRYLQLAQDARRPVAQPVMQFHLPIAAPVLPRTAAAAIPV